MAGRIKYISETSHVEIPFDLNLMALSWFALASQFDVGFYSSFIRGFHGYLYDRRRLLLLVCHFTHVGTWSAQRGGPLLDPSCLLCVTQRVATIQNYKKKKKSLLAWPSGRTKWLAFSSIHIEYHIYHFFWSLIYPAFNINVNAAILNHWAWGTTCCHHPQ